MAKKWFALIDEYNYEGESFEGLVLAEESELEDFVEQINNERYEAGSDAYLRYEAPKRYGSIDKMRKAWESEAAAYQCGDDEDEEFDESKDNETAPPVIREPIADGHIRVVVGNSFERRSLDVVPERTLKDVITESEVDFSECGPFGLNGIPLGSKDLEHSFDDFGIKPGYVCHITAFRISRNVCLAEGVLI